MSQDARQALECETPLMRAFGVSAEGVALPASVPAAPQVDVPPMRVCEDGTVVEASPPGPVRVPGRLRQRILATMQANPGVEVDELVRRFEETIPGSGPAVRQVAAEIGEQ